MKDKQPGGLDGTIFNNRRRRASPGICAPSMDACVNTDCTVPNLER